jgi:hypothetical protein
MALVSKNAVAPEEAKNEGYWWKMAKDVHATLFSLCTRLQQQQSGRQIENLKYLRLYGDQQLMGLTPLGFSRAASSPDAQAPNAATRERLTFNVVRMAIDTLAAKIAKNRPKPTFVTDGGDYEQQKRAKQLDKFVQGVFYQVQLAVLAVQAFIDGCVTDVGVLHWYRDGSRICCERVLPGELFVDEVDGMYGQPRQLVRIKAVQREVLLEQFPAHAAKILAAKAPTMLTTASAAQRLADMVEVTEAWHLPTCSVDEPEEGKEQNARGGRHVIAVDNADLLDEPWTRDEFPFAVFRWSRRLVGWYGQGVAEQLSGDQLAINKLLKTIGAILHLMSVPRYFVEETSEIVEDHLNNSIGAIVKYRGTPPQLSVMDAVPKELFGELEQRKARAFERVGVSQLSVAAKKPAGLDAGVALREYNDIEAERFVITGQAWEQFHLDCARQVIALGEEIAADPDHAKDFDVAVSSKGGVERIRWQDVQLDRDAYVMKMMPTSSLPTTPAAKQQAVMEWQNAGWIEAIEARQLLDFPDIEQSNDLAFAAREDIHWTAQRLLDGDKYFAPEPQQDLQYGIRHVLATYLRARRMKVPEERKRNLLTWLETAQDMLAKSAPPAPTAAPPGPAAPPPPSAPLGV